MTPPYEIQKNLFGKHSVHYACPKCGERLKSPLADAGTQDSCPDCRVQFVAPGLRERLEVEEARQAAENERRLAVEKRREERRAKKKEKQERARAKHYRREQQQSTSRAPPLEDTPADLGQPSKKSLSGDVDEQLSPLEQSRDFVRQKFFDIHDEYVRLIREKYCNNASVKLEQTAWSRFEKAYASKYGEGARAYLNKTINGWRDGWTGMSGQTMYRILEGVPRYLEIDEQFELLAFFVPPAISEQFNWQHVALSEIAGCYSQIASSVKCKEYKLPWFVSDVFSEQEITEFLNVFRFMMIDGLRRSYHDVREDLVTLQQACTAIDAAIHIDYRIALLDCPLDVDTSPSSMPPSLEISAPEPRLVTEFRRQYRQILLEHVVQARATMREGDIRQRMAIGDIDSVIRQLNRTKSDQEYESTLAIEGRGGDFTVRFAKKNLLRLRYAIAVECAKLAAAVVGTVSGALALLIFASDALPCMLYVLGALLFSVVGGIWTKLQSLRSEVKEYERQRRTGVAPPRH